jgi:hypothetical protein
MAQVTEPAHVLPQYQKPWHFLLNPVGRVSQAKVRKQVEPVMTQRGPIEARIIDDTSFPKQGSIPSRCCSHPMEDVVPYGGDAEPLAMKSIHAAIAPRRPQEPGAPFCRPAPAIDAKKDKPADLPQVACGGSYL